MNAKNDHPCISTPLAAPTPMDTPLPGTDDTAYWEAISRDDQRALWHPYTSMVDPLPSYAVRRAEGTRIQLADGRWLVDGMASWWAAIHGYNVDAINRAANRQLQNMSHVMFGGITHAPAVELARLLRTLVPEPLEHIFYADSGSVSVEVALKVALQYQMARGRGDRTRMLAFEGGYHGDTTGAMALTDPVGGMHTLFKGILAKHIFAPRPKIAYDQPWDPEEGRKLRALIDAHADEIAAVFCEPIVQGAGGMRFYHPEYLRVIRAACDAHDILFVADEIATGFGRTGRLWGCDHAGVSPDVMCIGKALTGGYLTLAATLTTHEVATVMADSPAGVLMHGPTFMGNPLAVSIARASVSLLAQSPWEQRVARLQTWLRERLMPLASNPCVDDVRVLGAIGVVQLDRPVDVAYLQRIFVAHGAWIRPFRDLIYVMPPYISSEDDIDVLADAIRAGIYSIDKS